jgi:L,D-peptidoglycan transpeptidase YkuD (ErfK/YbiS/YcfS/YnhG family)
MSRRLPHGEAPAAAVVSGLAAASARGTIRLGGLAWPCALGRAGRRARKREGDGATPVGCWRIAGVLYRADRVRRPQTGLPVRPIHRDDGWCDAPADRNYNRAVRHPYPASAERLWRADHLYDVVVLLTHNRRPRVRGRGSAIFVHLARPGYAPTEGCIALKPEHLRHLVQRFRPGSRVRVLP